MSDDSFTTLTEQSWFGRLANSIKSVLVGLVLFLVAFPLLWWNEGRAVNMAKSLTELAEAVVTVPSANKVDPANDKKAVHMTALATTQNTLSDPYFPVSLTAVKLRREVKMYQWEEKKESKTEKKLGGGERTVTTTRYEPVWSDKLIDSGKFEAMGRKGHENPDAMRYTGDVQAAKEVRFGAFTLPGTLVDQMSDYQRLLFGSDLLGKLPEALQKQAFVESDVLYLPTDPKGERPDPRRPKIGNLQISFGAVKPGTVSIIARQLGATFEPWTSSNGREIAKLAAGTVSAENMVGKMEAENATLTWILRLVGFVLMAVGVGLLSNPLAVLANVLPLLGDVLRAGVGLFAVMVAGALSLVTIAVAWLAYRPVLGVLLLAAAMALVVVVRKLFGRRRVAAA